MFNRIVWSRVAGAVLPPALLLCFGIGAAVGIAAPDETEEITITISAPLERGLVPLPVHFVAEIVAPAEMDQEIYELGQEWLIMGRFVLSDPYTGGDPLPPDMRSRPTSISEQMLRSTKHLVSRMRRRPPREPYEPDMEVQRSFEFDYTFDRAGEYFVSFRLGRNRYLSNEIRIVVRGDTSFDPLRP